MKILLVEDDFPNREFFCDVLEGAGHEVHVEVDGAAGRARATSDQFDLIILDVQLPLLRGDALCRELREFGLSTPIFALSANALPAQVAAGLGAGFDAYLTKPITPAALRSAVESVARTV